MNPYTCNDCGSINLITHVADGDIVCRDCGLVKQGCYLDDTYNYNKSFNDDILPCYETQNIIEKPVDCSMLNIIKEVYDTLFEGDNNHNLIVSTMHLCEVAKNSMKNKKGSHKRAIIAAAVYCTCRFQKRGKRAEDIYKLLRIDVWQDFSAVCQAWKDLKEFSNVGNITSGDNTSIATRMVYDNKFIPEGKQWDVLKTIKKLMSIIEASTMKSNVRLSKLNASLIFIACEINCCSVSRANICDLYGISSITLKKHEALIQEVLKAS